MARLTLTVCDVCKNKDRDTKTYIVTGDELRRSVDLCAEHAKPLDALLKGAEAKPKGGRKPTTSRLTITNLDEG